ncbi:hypothetical protein GCM10027399_10660 [Curvibacter fontanus]
MAGRGEQRPFIACVALLQREEWQRLGLDPEAPTSLTDARAVKAALKDIAQATASFARYAVPRNTHLVREPWTIGYGFMTPTLKLNRLMEHYATASEGRYQKQAGRRGPGRSGG